MFYVLSQHIYDLNLAFRSTFRNFSYGEVTPSRQKKTSFFVLLSIFRNFARAFVQYNIVILYFLWILLY